MTEIRLHNSLTRRKEAFAPLDPQNVRMYVCGPTVYDRAHIGNARPVVVFDVLYRLLRHVYGADHVTYVRNITDIDDKIMVRAKERGVSIDEVTAETTAWFLDDMKALGALAPDFQPRATEYVPQMVAMIEDLIAKGFAYEAEGHVLFEVAKYSRYGALSGRSVEDMIAGARVEVAPYKRDPMDFVLWKPSAADQPGWDSPWGRGRPGWHIECSAMAKAILMPEPDDELDGFDIHGGGADLQFPHHENEIAQSCCARDNAKFARVWLHNGMINVDGRKMSKSLGNFLTVQDLREQAPGEVLRLALLSTHYRGVLDWTEQKVHEAAETLRKWGALVEGVEPAPGGAAPVVEALADDLNTPAAFAEMHRMAREDKAGALAAAMALMNLSAPNLEMFEQALEGEREVVEELLERRRDARTSKDFSRADRIRDGLIDAGIQVMDVPGEPSQWKRDGAFDPIKLHALLREVQG